MVCLGVLTLLLLKCFLRDSFRFFFHFGSTRTNLSFQVTNGVICFRYTETKYSVSFDFDQTAKQIPSFNSNRLKEFLVGLYTIEYPVLQKYNIKLSGGLGRTIRKNNKANILALKMNVLLSWFRWNNTYNFFKYNSPFSLSNVAKTRDHCFR